MEKFFVFVAEQWALFTVLAGLLLAFAWLESRRGAQGVSPHGLTQMVNGESALVVDLREKAEYAAGHIVDAVNVPYAQVKKQMSMLEDNKSRPIIFVCKMGQQSSALCKQLREQGFEKIFRLSGGMMEWQSAQMPLVK